MYKPNPLDTSSIVLPETLKTCIEQLARNTHEVWAQGRMKQGWVYGATLDMGAKTHPDLVPYDQLLESEKEYDRQTATQVVKVLLMLGYHVV